MAFLSAAMVVIFGTLSAFTVSFARAEEATQDAITEGHPCAEYVKHCKSQDLTPGHGLWKCVAKEAKKANNEVCMAKLKEGAKKMREQKKNKANAEKEAE